MIRKIMLLTLLVFFSLACSLGGLIGGEDSASQAEEPPQSEDRCGDNVCDGPENEKNCPQDCSAQAQQSPSSAKGSGAGSSEYGILYQVIENALSSYDMSSNTCYALNFIQFLDGGLINTDGSNNQTLEMKDYPTSMLTSKKKEAYYYISSPQNPVQEMFGFSMFNWDVDGQTLWASDFSGGAPVEVVPSSAGMFPGGVSASPQNEYLLYPMTRAAQANQTQAAGVVQSSFNPFVSDSSLIVDDLTGGGEQKVLADSYNRQLFTSFADFSPDGNNFFTIAREGENFKFVKVSLTDGEVTDFARLFPGFDWSKLNWDAFFPRSEDFAYASFSISPDETRLIAYKNIFTANMQNACVTDASHNLWVFDLEANSMQRFEDQQGYVSDSTWKYDSSQFALSIMGNAGCYPDYLDAKIDSFDKEGQLVATLVSEPKSKITNISWSPDGSGIAYDVYSTDYIGRLKIVDVDTKQVSEVTNTQALGHQVDTSKPVMLLFADWVSLN